MQSGLISVPSVAKACSRCRARKVKCDLTLPQCSPCVKQNEECNIIDCVAYPYSIVAKLEDDVKSLRARLSAATNSASSDALHQGRSSSAQAVDKQAEEIGVLAVGGTSHQTDGTYVGSAAGSSFARMFLRQIAFEHDGTSGLSAEFTDPCPAQTIATLPPYPTALHLLRCYIAQVHMWWPFLHLPVLRRDLEAVYRNPANSTDSQKFVVFAMLALSSAESRSDQDYRRLMDLNEPAAYFRTCLRFSEALHNHPQHVFKVQGFLLLGLWMLDSRVSRDCNDLWQLSRYIMSAAIEGGLHRQYASWHFSTDEQETRTRTWWCSYNLERLVATLTGRVLSIRDHAVHARQPEVQDFDTLNPSETKVAAIYGTHNVVPFRLLIRLRQISGRILESVYIARAADGTAFNTTFQQIYMLSDEVRSLLFAWRTDFRAANLGICKESSMLNIEYCSLQLLLNRPNPTFMLPSQPMLDVCSEAVSEAMREWSSIESAFGTTAICRGFRQFHSILLVGLAGLYNDWHSQVRPDSGEGMDLPLNHRHQHDSSICLDLLRRAADHLAISGISRYATLYETIRRKVYSTGSVDATTRPRDSTLDNGGGTITAHTNVPEDLDGGSFGAMPQQFDPETYRDHLSGFFDDDILAQDDVLFSWYDAIMRDA